MRIDVLTFDGCPNHQSALALVREVVAELGVEAEIREVEIRSPEDVVARRFLGSPTIQIDGIDIEAARRDDTRFAMSCRRYGESGRVPRELLEHALMEAVQS